uniref:Uncharacterized protein n=1 Tax=Panagrolaimus sp. PS1159 TaxID=55785 RepID=A0AC35FKM1_9BILA
MKAINYIKCSNFIRLDKYDAFDGEKEKEEENVPKFVLHDTKVGRELENYMIKSKEELLTIVIQVATTMAMREETKK